MPVRIVDDRVLLLGLDRLYRESMKLFEAVTLLPCARTVAASLGVEAAREQPVEGYYGESPLLREYFALMRALQQVPSAQAGPVEGRPELARLIEASASPIFGRANYLRGDTQMMLPTGRDALTLALDRTDVKLWSAEILAAAARRVAIEDDEISLVGLAARAGDAVVVAALRESVVLYAECLEYIGDDDEEPERYEYDWRVHPDLQRAANRMITLFNHLVAHANARVPLPDRVEAGFELVCPREIPPAEPAYAETFYVSSLDNDIVGRCARIAQTLDGRKYHWGVRRTEHGALEVEDFWSRELWTSERYRRSLADQHAGAGARAPGLTRASGPSAGG